MSRGNSCIELWFILHIEDQTAAIERHTAQRRSAELLGCDKNLTIAATELMYEPSTKVAAAPRALTQSTTVTGRPNEATQAATYGDSSIMPAR